jgi:hypothetical protein
MSELIGYGMLLGGAIAVLSYVMPRLASMAYFRSKLEFTRTLMCNMKPSGDDSNGI